MKKILVLGILSLVVVSSCKKDKEDCTTTVATITGNYKITAVTYKQTPASAETDVFDNPAFFDPCEKNVVHELKTGGAYTYNDPGTTCGGDYDATWSLNGSVITIDGEDATIQSFDCTTLIAYAEAGFVPGDRITTTLVKQ